MKRVLILVGLVVIAAGVRLVGCGGGGASPTTPASVPISIEGLDGATDVAVDSSFTYAFDSAIDTSTVDTSTFFIVPTPTTNLASPFKAALDTSTCDVANALSTSVTCDSSTSCTLDPTSDLSNGTTYSLCLTTDITYAYNNGSFFIREAYAGDPFEGFMATFTTVEAADAGISTVNSLDGDTDVSTSSTFKYNFGKAVDTSTVTSSTFYLVTTASADMSVEMYDSIYKAEFNSTTCNVNEAIAATISCDTISCTLTPTASLPGSTITIACLTDEIFYEDGTSFPAFMASFTTAASTAPSAPANVSVTAGDAANTLSWDAASGATSYNIYWANTSGVTTSSNKITGATSPYSHTSLTNSTAYYYIVAAVNADGESGLSSEVSATPVAAPVVVTLPGAPANPTVTVGYGRLTVSWDSVAGATSYNIYWSATTGVTKLTGTPITGVTSGYILSSNFQGGTERYVVVTAVNAGGESDDSVEASGTAGYRVFITSTSSNGNLGGLAGADSDCAALAQSAGFPNFASYKAWLSDLPGEGDAKDRITSAGPWGLVDGVTKVADSMTAIIANAAIDNKIDMDELGGTGIVANVWTGTDTDGTALAVCNAGGPWLDDSGAVGGDFGDSTQTGSRWTVFLVRTCDQTHRLYCFESD